MTKTGRSEPSMDEILASIREIISEDAETRDKPKPKEAGTTSAADDVLELTEVVENDGKVTSLDRPESREEPIPENTVAAVPPPPPAGDAAGPAPSHSEERTMTESRTSVPPAKPADPTPPPTSNEGTEDEILSGTAAAASSAALGQLATTIARQGRERTAVDSLGMSAATLDDLVREALKPLLKDWLDKNLPALVERIVQKEIQKLARRIEDRFD